MLKKTGSLGSKIFVLCVLGLSNSGMEAQTCSELSLNQSSELHLTRNSFSNYVASTLHLSVVSEFATSEKGVPEAMVTLPSGPFALLEAIRSLVGTPEVGCSIDEGVLHLYDTRVLSSPNNPLNHVFSGFAVPENASLFFIEFRGRLRREAFDQSKADIMAGPGGGILPEGSRSLSLRPEIVHGLSAREVFLHVAREAAMSLSIDVPLSAPNGAARAWAESQGLMTIDIVR